jgi:formylglycine-generating enzyme required for sulfatase activity
MDAKSFNRVGFWGGLFLLALAVGTVVPAQPANARPTIPLVRLPLLLKSADIPHSERVYIPAGTFLMGCDVDHSAGYWCYEDELPLHTVYLDAYWVDTTEVTNARYAQYVAAGSCTPPSVVSSAQRQHYYDDLQYANYPVIYVSWVKAQAFCTWAGGGLPTEAQWERTARGSADTRPYPWGDQFPDCTLANFLQRTGLCVGDTIEVGNYPNGASPTGALDMAGNVLEWVYDYYATNYYSISPLENPTGPIYGESRVFRGGSFLNDANRLRVSYRSGDFGGYAAADLGFRCVYSPGP